jgi:type IV pilus assembly protein PilQ
MTQIQHQKNRTFNVRKLCNLQTQQTFGSFIALLMLGLCSCTSSRQISQINNSGPAAVRIAANNNSNPVTHQQLTKPKKFSLNSNELPPLSVASKTAQSRNIYSSNRNWVLQAKNDAGDGKPQLGLPKPTPRNEAVRIVGFEKSASTQNPQAMPVSAQRVITIDGQSASATFEKKKPGTAPPPKPINPAFLPPITQSTNTLVKVPKTLPENTSVEKPTVSVPSVNSKERFSLKIQKSDISEVIEMLGKMSEYNVFLGKNVTGEVSANLRNVTVDEALHGILKSMGYVAEIDGRFLYVMTTADADARKKAQRKLVSKIYRPNYISVKDLQSLITPMLTPAPIGKVAATTTSEVGIETDAKKAGGDSLSQRDALLVQDYPEVLREVDAIITDLDVPPMQVVIEAMILQVTLNDRMALGVNFALLNNSRSNLLVSGNGQQLNNSSGFPGAAAGADDIVPAMGSFIAPALGLKYGFLRGDLSGFVEALETVGDTNLIASPQIRVLNKQKANLIIGDRLGYSTFTNNGTESIQNISFLDVGTKLVIRPFISRDGLVRLEVHPEQSSGFIDNNGIPQSRTTEVTTNVMVRDGSTVVLGGLIETDTMETYDRVPLLGSLPWIGNVFRRKEESTRRRELIVLITPRIVREPADAVQGDTVRHENENRARHFRHNLSRINRTSLARMHMQLAQKSFDRGELLKAERHVTDALRHSKNDMDALRLREQIRAAFEEHKKNWTRFPLSPTDFSLRPASSTSVPTPSQ